MNNEAKNLLNEYLLINTSFIIQKEWELPDESKVSLLRRESLNTYLRKKDCNFSSSNLDIKNSTWYKIKLHMERRIDKKFKHFYRIYY